MSFFRAAIFFGLLATLAALSMISLGRAIAPRRFAQPRALRRLRLGAAAATIAIVLLEAFARRHAPVGGGWFRVPVALARVLVFGALMTGILLRFVRMAEWVLFRFARKPTAPSPSEAAPSPVEALTRREAFARAGAFTVAGITASGMSFGGLYAARDLQVRDIEIYIPDLPPTLEGLTLVQLTDLHAGIFTGPRDFGAVVERTRALRPDLVVLTGDLLDNNPAHVPDAMRMFSQLHGRLGRYAILGNHDYYTGHRAVLDGLRRSGITPLVNQGIVIPSGTRHPGLALLGVDDVMAQRTFPDRRPDLDRALRDVPIDAPRILLAHNPTLFTEYAGRVALQLSGHTHGGQINPASITRLVLRYVSGRYEQKGSVLYVSNGSGLTGPPVRLNAPPEVVRIGLTGRRRG